MYPLCLLYLFSKENDVKNTSLQNWPDDLENPVETRIPHADLPFYLKKKLGTFNLNAKCPADFTSHSVKSYFVNFPQTYRKTFWCMHRLIT